MTPVEIRALPYRELDALVAEKVMGWKVEREVWDTRSQDELTPKYDFGVREADRHVKMRVPNFSRSIDSAWLVVEKMANGLTLEHDGLGTGNWSACVWSERACAWRQAEAATAPRAICEAALLAVGEHNA